MSGWISVDELLPESDGMYMVSDGERVGMCYYDTRAAKMYANKKYGFESIQYPDPDGHPSTHWQPLPEPPK